MGHGVGFYLVKGDEMSEEKVGLEVVAYSWVSRSLERTMLGDKPPAPHIGARNVYALIKQSDAAAIIAELEASLEIEKGQCELREEENRILFASVEAQAAALAESRANDRQGMAYLAQVRKVVGGADFPDMVSRVEAQSAALAKARDALSKARGWFAYAGIRIEQNAMSEALSAIDALEKGNNNE